MGAMTSLLPAATAPRRTTSEVQRDLGHRRPLVLIATLGGVAAAAATLLVCCAVGVLGWFLTDAGAHGAPRDALTAGTLGWLMAHGSGVVVQGAAVSAVPLGLTVLLGWVVWRVAHRVGDSVSGHGPDADRIADGERDWTVPVATGLFATGYVGVAVLALTLAATPATSPDATRVVVWSLALCALLGGPAIAIGSGRAAIWAAFLPASARASAVVVRRLLTAWLALAAVAFLVALLVDAGTALNVGSQLRTGPTDTVVFALLSAGALPNAVVFAGSYLLGPGFAVGAGTLVSPSAVVIGPLPMFPMLAALPDEGPTPAWTTYLMVAPVLLAALVVARVQRSRPTLRFDEGALRGCVGGALAGVVFAAMAAVAGGAVGPGRMRVVGPVALDVLVHAVTAFGIGGLLGGLAMTWWQRRPLVRAADERRRPGRVPRRVLKGGHRGSRRTTPPRRSRGSARAGPARADPGRPQHPPSLDSRPCPPPDLRVSSCSSRVRGPTSRPSSTPARTRRTAPAWSPSAPTVTASRVWPAPSAPASRRSCCGCATTTIAPQWDRALRDAVAVHEPDLVVLAGFMKLAGEDFLAAFGGRIVNTHPALSPSFPGMAGPADALAHGVKVTGCTLFVVDSGVDTGPIVAQRAVPVEDDDDVATLHERIKVAERSMLVDTVGRMARDGFTIHDRKVRFGHE